MEPPGKPGRFTFEQFDVFTLTSAFLHFDSVEQRDEIHINGDFTLGESSNGIDPLTETVIVNMASRTVTLPPGSFVFDGSVYSATKMIGMTNVQITITPLVASDFQWSASVMDTRLGRIRNPVFVSLRIGDDTGNATERLTGDLMLP